MDTAIEMRSGLQPSLTNDATKTRFRNLFVRRRTTPEEQVFSGIESRPSSAVAHTIGDLDSIPLAERPVSRETKGEVILTEAPRPQTRSKSRPRKQNPSSSSIAPWSLPFSQACAQASLHSMMKVPSPQAGNAPSSTVESQLPLLSSTVDSLSNRDGAGMPQPGHPTPSPRRREMVANAISKSFCLLENGTILQYESDGLPDRMPEASYRIALETIVSTKEIVPCSFWMLEMHSLTDTLADSKAGSARTTWTRMSFRSAEVKEVTCDLTVIFDDKILMSSWLDMIRSKIDIVVRHNNELESQIDRPRPKTPSTRSVSRERSSSRPAFLRFSKSSSNLRNELSSTNTQLKELPKLPVPLHAANKKSASGQSIAASSVTTVTSLDGLRDSDTGSTTTATTNSLDGSVALESPIKETFASISSPVLSIDSRCSPLIGHNEFKDPLANLSSHEQYRSSFKPISAQSSTASPVSPDQSTPSAVVTVTEEPSIFISSPEGDVDDARANQFESAHTSRSRYPERRSSLLPTTPINVDVISHESETAYASSKHVRQTTKSSVESHSKAMYSLFPKKMVHEIRVEPHPSIEPDRVLGLPSNEELPQLSSPTSGSKFLTGKRPTALQLLSPARIEQPQRSPAVTDDMLAANFGVLPSASYHTAPSPKKFDVPDLADLCRLLEASRTAAAVRQESPERTSSACTDRTSRGLPNVQAASLAPLGPPPRGPLPAIPATEVTAASRRTSSRPRHTSEKTSRQNSPDISPVDGDTSLSSTLNTLISAKPEHDHHKFRSRDLGMSGKSTPRTSPLRPRKDSIGVPTVIPIMMPPQHLQGKQQHDLRTAKSFHGHRRARSGSDKFVTASVSSVSSFDSILGKIGPAVPSLHMQK